jgi:photosystem II stability/assembly factor-like uncharacterized protein
MAGVGLAALLTGCGFAPRPQHTSVASPSVAAKPVVSGNLSLARQSRPFVYFAAVGGLNQVLVVVGTGPVVRLFAATAAGTDVHDIGPQVPAGEIPDSVFFLDRQHGWLATYSGAGDGETLYRTRDGGRRWQAYPAPSHVTAPLGTADVLQFVTPDVGWLADVEPTGPVERLYQTTDGGASWQQIAALNQNLPRLGVVEFEPGDAVGWLGGMQYFPRPLDVTTDQGRGWQPAALPGSPADGAPGLPAIFGSTLIEPVVDCSAGTTDLRTYRSADNGAQWSLSSTAFVARGCQQVSATFPSQTAGWAAALSNGRVVVERTTDRGRHWRTVAVPDLKTSYAPEIVAPDARHAWLLVTGPEVNGSSVYVTDDAGKTWRRIDQSFTS